MAWRRHTRKTTKEVFYDGTTIDGSRLEKAMDEVVESVNDVKKGSLKQRFVATQYHAGFNPISRVSAKQYHHFPFLRAENYVGTTTGAMPENAPYNRLRFKSSVFHGWEPNNNGLSGNQFIWTRSFYFGRPVIVHAVSALMQVDFTPAANMPYIGSYSHTVDPYTYDTAAGGAPPAHFAAGADTMDTFVIMDVMNPGSPEDAELADLEFVRARFVINEERTFVVAPSPTPGPWADMAPAYNSGDIATAGPMQGRLVEHRDLNIPVHEGSRVRLAVSLPLYDGTTITRGSWGTIPWYLQAWSLTLTVLEEVQSL